MFLLLEKTLDTAGGAAPYVYTSSRPNYEEIRELKELLSSEPQIGGWHRQFIITEVVG